MQASSRALCVCAWCRCTAASLASSLLTRLALMHSVRATGPTVPLGNCIMHTGSVVVATPRVASCTHTTISVHQSWTPKTKSPKHGLPQGAHPTQTAPYTPLYIGLCMEKSTTTKWSWLPSTCASTVPTHTVSHTTRAASQRRRPRAPHTRQQRATPIMTHSRWYTVYM